MTKTHKGCLHTEMTIKLKHKLFFKRITNYPLKKKKKSIAEQGNSILYLPPPFKQQV